MTFAPFCRFLAPAAALFFLVTLSGCPNPNTYGTPRTVPAGKVQIVAALEGVGISESAPNGNGGTTTTSAYAPTLPTVGVRIGLTDEVDLGLRISQLSSLQGDVKINFLKSQVFDMAVAPGVQGAYVGTINTGNGSTSLGLVYLNLPLILGINFSHATTLVLTPGFTYLLATASVDNGSGSSAYASGSAPLARMGVGFNARIGNVLAIQPEVTLLKGFNSADATIWNFGVGFAFRTSQNSMPDYSDVK
jgi:hypothetical protein